MSASLPPVGTIALLELLCDYVPDDFIAGCAPRTFTGGRRHGLSAAQLWRVHLLAVLTSTYSLNLLVAQLPNNPPGDGSPGCGDNSPARGCFSSSAGKWA